MALKPDQFAQAQTILTALPLFAGCSPEQIQAMAAKLERKELAAGKVAMMDQEINRTLYILATGKIGVWKRIGGEKKQLATLAAPNFFGERSMFEESAASALVKTEENCVLFTLEKKFFDEIARLYPVMIEVVRKNMEAVRAQRMGPPAREPSND